MHSGLGATELPPRKQSLSQESKALVRAQEATADGTEVLHILAWGAAEGNQAAEQWSTEKRQQELFILCPPNSKSKKKVFCKSNAEM